MDNHVHILLKILKKNLPESMHWLFMNYAKNFSKKYQRMGHLFTSRYKSILCLNDSYFLQVSRYIHLNPVKANLATNPYIYQWSSCNLFNKPDKWKDAFVNVDFTLSFFTKNKLEAAKEYKEFLKDGIKSKKGFKYPSLIFENILAKMEDLAKIEDEISANEALRIIRGNSMNEESLNFLSSRSKQKIAARDYLIYQKRKKGDKLIDIAKEMRMSVRTISRAIKRVEGWKATFSKHDTFTPVV